VLFKDKQLILEEILWRFVAVCAIKALRLEKVLAIPIEKPIVYFPPTFNGYA